MIHVMKLQKDYFNYIQKGTKKIEIRLNDEKRQLIKIGDTIKFLKLPELKESLNVKVINIVKYNSFEELVNNNDISLLADKSITKNELLNILNSIYSKEEQKKYGVIGIYIYINN